MAKTTRGASGGDKKPAAKAMPVADFLTRKKLGEPPPILAIVGDCEFFRRQARQRIRSWVLGPDGDDLAYMTFDGPHADLRAVLDELRTPPFFGEVRLVVMRDADPFITKNREPLERYAAAPSPYGTLLFEAVTMPSNTRLYKAIAASGLVLDAKAPAARFLAGWVCKWGAAEHGVEIQPPDAEWLVELVGAEPGILDQELRKLATYVGPGGQIDRATVTRLAADTPSESVFALIDAALSGNPRRGLQLLDESLAAGEAAVKILVMLTTQLQRIAQTDRLLAAGVGPIEQAMEQAGVLPFLRGKVREQMNHLGRARIATLYRRLLQADLDLKGGTALSDRGVLERLLLEFGVPK